MKIKNLLAGVLVLAAAAIVAVGPIKERIAAATNDKEEESTEIEAEANEDEEES